MLTITPFYALPLVAGYILLSIRVIGGRRANRVSLGDGGQPDLLARMRAHGNFAEFAPLGLLLMMMAELAGAPALPVHLAGLALVAGRGLHAWAIGWRGPMRARVGGMALTFAALSLAAAAAVWPGLARLF